MTEPAIVASVLGADYSRLAGEVLDLQAAGVDRIQWDVMDGRFVPNLTFGAAVVGACRPYVDLPFEAHLMVEDPDHGLEEFVSAGCSTVIVHVEACRHLHRTLQLIEHHGMKPAVVLNPATRVELIRDILPMLHHVLIMSVNPGFGGQEFIPFSLDKIRRLAQLRQEMGLAFKIEVDGGVAHDTVAQVVQAGAELLVAGNAVFGAGEAERDARELLAAARKAAGE